MAPRLTDDAVRRTRLRGQLLVRPQGAGRPGRGGGRGVQDVVGALVGVQAQDATAAALALRCRDGCASVDEVNRARDDRRVVLTWSLRGTRHLHRADDVRGLVGLLGPALLRPSRRAEELGIAGAAGERAVAVLRDALAEEGPLTRDQVKARLAPHGVDPTGQAAIHVVWRAAMEGLLCVVPGERYALLDDWLGPPPDGSAAAQFDAGSIVRRYLAAFGPATPDDFAAWSGLGRPAARRAWAVSQPSWSGSRRPPVRHGCWAAPTRVAWLTRLTSVTRVTRACGCSAPSTRSSSATPTGVSTWRPSTRPCSTGGAGW